MRCLSGVKRFNAPSWMLYTPRKRCPISIGQESGRTRTCSSASISSSRSNGSRPSLSILLMNTITGVLRIRHTSMRRRVWASTPLAPSMTMMTLSTAVRVRNVSSAKSWWPGVSRMLILCPWYSNPITDVATDIPRCFSISIQSLVAVFLILLLLTAPATWMAPPKRRSFSVSVVFPASGWLIIANVRRLSISSLYS